MRYFLKEFHKAANSADTGSDLLTLHTNFGFSRAKQKRLTQKELALSQAYFESLHRLKPRLSARAWKFFFPTQPGKGLHDATLLSFEAGDAIDADEAMRLNPKYYRHSVRLRFLSYERDRVTTFKYSGVVRATFDFPSSDPLHYERGDGIGYQLVDEIVALDDKTLRHEHYFESGAEICVDFERLILAEERLKLPKPKAKS